MEGASPSRMDLAGPANVEAVDKIRQELEANVNKLRSTLQHWQKCEIDYGEFHEKVDDLAVEPGYDSLKSIRDSIDAAIPDKEVEELLGLDKGITRTRAQIGALLIRRVEYVQQNISSLKKQLNSAEERLEKLEYTDESAFEDEQGLPITEIVEELDSEGNVISGRTSTAQDAANGAAGLLSKAGVQDWSDPAPRSTATKPDFLEPGLGHMSGDLTGGPADSPGAGAGTTKTTKRKKSVAFAPEIDVAPAPARRTSSPPPLRSTSPPPPALPPTPIKSRPSVPWEVDEARKGRFHSGTRVIEVNDDDEEVGSLPVVPPADFEESEEDAELRREMTQYALNEVGAIVAQMDLEEGSDYDEYNDDDEDADPDGDHRMNSDAEDENEYGMTAFDRISDKDRKEMLELEKKLQAKMMHNLGPQPDTGGMDVDVDDVRRLVVKTDSKTDAAEGDRRSSKVHFADEDEVLPTPIEPASAVEGTKPLADAIVERTNPATTAREATPGQTKPSRFKSAMSNSATAPPQKGSQSASHGQSIPNVPVHLREEESQEEQRSGPFSEPPHGPEGQVLSKEILERPTQSNNVLPPDESGMDPALLKQELAVENRRLFNKMVQQQGGFKPSPEDEDSPLMEERDGKVRKVSRFKAARINAGGI